MSDQAAGLRRLRAATPVAADDARHGAHALAIGSGKGGVGKSCCAVMLAAALARRGRRVLLVDGAQNQGNLHVLLGVRAAGELESLLSGEVDPATLAVPVADGLWLLPGESGGETVYGLTAIDRARLHHRITGIYDRFDHVVVDAGPGIESVVRATLRASRLVLVAVPEPASLSDAYAVAKIVNLQVPGLPVDVLVNRTLHADEGPATFQCLAHAAQRFLSRTLGDLGALAEDDAVRRAVRTPRGLLALAPAPIEAIAAALEPAVRCEAAA